MKRQNKRYEEITCTEYRLVCRKKTDPGLWFVKCYSKTREQLERFVQVLETASDIYIEFKIESVTVHKMIETGGR